MIKKIIITNFKGFEYREFNLTGKDIFIGKNGKGKTTIQEALYILLTGNHPTVGDTNGAVYDLVNDQGKPIQFTVILDNGSTVTREYAVSGKTISQNINIDGKSYMKKEGEELIAKFLGDFVYRINIGKILNDKQKDRMTMLSNIVGGTISLKKEDLISRIEEAVMTKYKEYADVLKYFIRKPREELKTPEEITYFLNTVGEEIKKESEPAYEQFQEIRERVLQIRYEDFNQFITDEADMLKKLFTGINSELKAYEQIVTNTPKILNKSQIDIFNKRKADLAKEKEDLTTKKTNFENNSSNVILKAELLATVDENVIAEETQVVSDKKSLAEKQKAYATQCTDTQAKIDANNLAYNASQRYKSAKTLYDSSEKNVTAIEAKISELKKILPDMVPINKKVADLEASRTKINEEIAILNSKKTSLSTIVDLMTHESDCSCPTCNRKVTKEASKMISDQFDDITKSLKVEQDKLSAINSEIINAKIPLTQGNKKHDELRGLEQDLKNAISSRDTNKKNMDKDKNHGYDEVLARTLVDEKKIYEQQKSTVISSISALDIKLTNITNMKQTKANAEKIIIDEKANWDEIHQGRLDTIDLDITANDESIKEFNKSLGVQEELDKSRAQMLLLTAKLNVVKHFRAVIVEVRNEIINTMTAPILGVANEIFNTLWGDSLKFEQDFVGITRKIKVKQGLQDMTIDRDISLNAMSGAEKAMFALSVIQGMLKLKTNEPPIILLDAETLDADVIGEVIKIVSKYDNANIIMLSYPKGVLADEKAQKVEEFNIIRL